MRKIAVISLLILFLSGCTSAGQSGNTQPAKKQDKEKVKNINEIQFGEVCEKCGKRFSYLDAHVDDKDSVFCPFCDHPVNSTMDNKSSDYSQHQEELEALKELEDSLNREIKRQKRTEDSK